MLRRVIYITPLRVWRRSVKIIQGGRIKEYRATKASRGRLQRVRGRHLGTAYNQGRIITIYRPGGDCV